MTADLFNPGWYWRHNPDVAAAVEAGLIDPRTHFEIFGRYEGRAPGPGFNPDYYLARNPDIAAAVEAGLMTAYDHFLLFGIAEGRSFLAHFDAEFYAQRNPDIGAAIQQGLTTAIDHFLQFGMHEQRVLNPFFDMGAYLRANPDVSAAVAQGLMTPLDHLMRFGLLEGRDLGNGISLAQFMNDPVFVQALSVEGGNTFDALARVNAVAPFFRGFESPDGWAPAPDTPIPVDFVPLPGVKLVVPSTVVVPDGMILPDTFEPLPGPVPPEPVPPVPPVPDDGGGGGPVTVHHLYDGDSVVAQPHDQRFVIHIDATEENVIKIGEYLEHQVIDLSQVPGLQVYSDAKERQLEVRQAEYDGTKWESSPDYDGESMGIWLHGKPHLQLTDKFGETARFHVGADANSFGYETVRVNGAPVGLGLVKPGAGHIVGGSQELLIGGDGTQVLWLGAGDMAVGGSGLDAGKSPDLFVAVEHTGAGPAIIGDYKYDQYDLIVPLFLVGSGSLMAPFDLTVRASDNHLVPGQGLVSNGGTKTDLEVVYEGEGEGKGKVFLHIANIDDAAAGAVSESVAFLVDDGSFAVYNVKEGGVIDTTDDAWPGGPFGLKDLAGDLGDDDLGCGCGLSLEYLIGGDGSQTITGGAADFAVLYGGAGNDELESDADMAIYIGGEGGDTITLGDGFGWVFFGGDALENGVDQITGFSADSDEDQAGDVLDFSHFLLGITFRDVLGGSDIDSFPGLGGSSGDCVDPEEALIVVKDFGSSDPPNDPAFATAKKVVAVNLHEDVPTGGSATIWFVDASSEVTEVIKVADLSYTGTLNEFNFMSTPVEVIIGPIV